MSDLSSMFNRLSLAHGRWAAALLLLATVVPLYLPGLTGVVLLAACVALVLTHRRGPHRREGLDLFRSPLGWMAALYVMYVVGLCWSTNLDYAGFDLQVKALLIVCPFVVYMVPKPARSGGGILLRAFTLASAAAAALCLAVAIGKYVLHVIAYQNGTMSVPTTAYFISSNFSLFMHPSYFAMNLLLALVYLERRRPALCVHKDIIRGLLIMGILLCASKVGWMALGLWWACALVIHGRDAIVRWQVFSGSIWSAILLGAFVMVSPFFQEKFDQLNNAAQGAPVDVSAQGSTESRELIWGAALPLIREHMPWGTGTGDVKDALIQRYTELDYTHAVELRLNAHSQLLQTPLTLGLPGALLLLMLFLLPGIHALRRRDELMIAFLALLALNWAVESMLETQAGVLFLAWGALMLAMRSSPTDHSII